MNTLLLDRTVWDLCLDANGNIAVASDPYALAQDAASAVKLFAGELWYDTAPGVPYFAQVLGKSPPLQFLKAQLAAAALTVPEVTDAQVFITGIAGRNVTGQIQVTNSSGATATVGF